MSTRLAAFNSTPSVCMASLSRTRSTASAIRSLEAQSRPKSCAHSSRTSRGGGRQHDQFMAAPPPKAAPAKIVMARPSVNKLPPSWYVSRKASASEQVCSSGDRHRPLSRSATVYPASANSAAMTAPPGPEPTTTQSQMTSARGMEVPPRGRSNDESCTRQRLKSTGPAARAARCNACKSGPEYPMAGQFGLFRPSPARMVT
mmetsp:Transcript_7134/g.17889  ORF Transcript_7134/g.17889 Transcript_7134/m.17889 type:complete len:202 (+) Transcript_7134:828-1433(+)